MFRWPLTLSGAPVAQPPVLELSPRGAWFTLRALLDLGHPVHLALIDAFLRGEVPFPRGLSLGHDSRTVLAGLVGPLVTLDRLGIRMAGLSDVVLLPPSTTGPAGRARFLINVPAQRPIWVDCADRVDDADRVESGGRDARQSTVTVELPRLAAHQPRIGQVRPPGPVRVVTHGPGPTPPAPTPEELALITALRTSAIGRAGRSPVVLARALPILERLVLPADDTGGAGGRSSLDQIRRDALAEAARLGIDRTPVAELSPVPPDRLAQRLGPTTPGVAATTTVWHGRRIDVALVTEPSGGPTLALLPRNGGQSGASAVAVMEGAAWATLEGLLAMELTERRSEPIALRLVGPDRTTELSIGRSMVLPRNRRVFAAWLGSDGRVLIRLNQ